VLRSAGRRGGRHHPGHPGAVARSSQRLRACSSTDDYRHRPSALSPYLFTSKWAKCKLKPTTGWSCAITTGDAKVNVPLQPGHPQSETHVLSCYPRVPKLVCEAPLRPMDENEDSKKEAYAAWVLSNFRAAMLTPSRLHPSGPNCCSGKLPRQARRTT
jgi:hypothetical protein